MLFLAKTWWLCFERRIEFRYPYDYVLGTVRLMIQLPSPALVGVVHLPPLPGSVRHILSMDEIIDRAVNDAKTLHQTGFDALIVENYGDMPFTRDRLPPAGIAAMTVVADRIRREAPLPLGINALRNDAISALGVAAAVGAVFIRVNVHTGVYATDQGIVEGKAHETLQYRRQLGAKVAILADVNVKHAVPLSDPDIARAAKDAAYRGLADGLVVTGPATGEPADLEELKRVREAVPDRRIFVGSGVTPETVAAHLMIANGVIVGTAIKVDGKTSNPVDAQRAKAFAHWAGRG